ncbi:MAG TPA: DUF4097 family beta strand repeat-containing protein [Candidatus Cybelea sp.]|jgi:hypothetical protein|nr:DUF4097 family beta strand repeat-containing protein [Candidatus Cybelea sp.]
MGLSAFARGIAAAFAIFAILEACSGAFGERVREEVHQTVSAGSAPAVVIENVAGAVRVEAWAKPIVDVEATKYGYNAEELHRVAIAVAREPGGVSIATHYGRGVHGGGVRYRIFVPHDASLQISNDAGAVDIAGVRGDVQIQTEAGEITADVGLVERNRSIDLRATTGALTLIVAPGSSATVQAASTVGDFTSNIPGVTQTRENLVGARGGGTIGTGSGRIKLATTTGAIALRQHP